MSIIGNLFGRSPIGPIQEHMKAAVSCAKQVLPFVEAMVEGDLEEMTRIRGEIVRLEHEADTTKHEIRSHLPKRLLMAVERRDMLEILDIQDSIADTAQDIAEIADMRRMIAPPSLREPLLALTRKVIVTCEQSQSTIEQLDELIETGFGPHEVAKVEEMVGALNDLESETDLLMEATQRALFAIEDELGVGTYFWYELIKWIADLADYAEKVGNRIRLLIAS
jgi:predicted phosphate transport protein (TIGR00153 family)